MWGNKTVSVIFPAAKESKVLSEAIKSFDSTGYVDEIIVVDGGTEPAMKEEIRRTRARLIKGNFILGETIKEGIKQTKADLIIVAEPNGAFKGQDILKLLSYSDDFDTVFGSRTHLPMLEKGSGMVFLRRFINFSLGKLINLLYFSSPLTDVGCTLRLTNRKGWNKIVKDCKSNDWIFLTEWVIIAAKNRVRYKEIPINYKRPEEKSYSNIGFHEQAWRGFKIFFYILKHRFGNTLI